MDEYHFGVGAIGPLGTAAHAADGSSGGASDSTCRRGRRLRRRDEPDSWVLLGAVAIALVPIVVATARAIHRGWLPLGDNGLMYIRSLDVLSSKPPLLGIWATGSITAKQIYNHPGPLLYDLLAVPTRLFGPPGMIITISLLNGGALIAIAFVGRRIGDTLLATVAVAAGAGLCWSMGSELLFDPWTPNSLLVLFLLFLMLIWTTSSGDLSALPYAVAVGCFLVETNLSYGLLVLVLWAWAVLGLLLHLRRSRRADIEQWPVVRARARRIGGVTAAVFVACWAQPVIEQFTSPGNGNLTRIVRGLPMITHTLGLRRAIQLVGGVTAVPPWWFRPSMERLSESLPSLAVASLSLAVVAALLVWFAFSARRRGDRTVSAAAVTAALAVVSGILSASKSPVYGDTLQAYQTRFLWPLAAFLTIVLVAGLIRRVVGLQRRRALLGLVALATVVAAVSNLPSSSSDGKTHAPNHTMPIAEDLVRQVEGFERDAPFAFHWNGSEPFEYQFYATALLADLRRRNVPFEVDEAFLIRTLGDDRRFTGHSVNEIVSMATGPRASVVPAGARRIAFHQGLTTEEQGDLNALQAQIRTYIRDGRLQLNDRGTTYFKQVAASAGQPLPLGNVDANELLGPSRSLLNLFGQGFLVLDQRWAPRFVRYRDLQTKADQQTVAVFAAPFGRPGVERLPTPMRP